MMIILFQFSLQPDGKQKEWSGEKYLQLISQLPSGYKIVLIGSEHDAENNKSIIENSNVPENV
ncbi:MAG: hypothetical protein IPM96_20975 [Ignavibacteria bacterium]|nr:hypothetical protein [Ignavibacteria bacterium]